MKKLMFLMSMLCGFVLFQTSCSKSSDSNGDSSNSTTTTTVSEDKTNIKSSMDKLSTVTTEFSSSDLFKMLNYHQVYNTETETYYTSVYNSVTNTWDEVPHTYTYGYYEYVFSSFVTTLGNKLTSVVDFSSVISNNKFNYTSLCGKYVWNSTTKKWDKSSYSSILLQFPSDSTVTTNNCEIGFTSYTSLSCNIEGTDVYLPTNASAYFTKNGTKIASIDLTASYTTYGIPVTAQATIYSKPFSVTTSLTQKSSSSFSGSLAITDETNSSNNISISADLALSNSVTKYTDFDDCKFSSIQATLIQGAMTIQGSADLKTISSLTSPTAADLNKLINFEVLYNNQKVGTLKVEDVNNQHYVFIVFKDGTEENSSIYYDSFISQLKSVFKSN